VSFATATGTSSLALPEGATVEISEGRVIFQPPARDQVEMPETQLSAIAPNTSALQVVRFEDPDDGALGGIVASASAPRLRRIQTVDMATFARRAGLTAGQSRTVILVAEIQEDGEPNQVDVARSSGNATVDAVAVDYALALRWIPATRERKPLSMRISFPITLALTE